MITNLTRFFLFLISTSATLSSLAQDIPFYESQLATASDARDQLVVLDSLVSKTRRVDTDRFISYSLQYIELAKQLDSVELAAKKMVNVSYYLTSVQNEPRKVVTLVDGLLARKYKIQDSFLLGSLYLKRGRANFKLDLNQAIKDYKNAIANYGEKDSVYVADAYLFSGQTYSNMGKFVPAGENYEKSYEIFELLKDYEYMYYARQGVTAMFSMNGFYDKAKEEREKNIQKIVELGLDHHLVTEYYNQALDFKKTGNTSQYLNYLLKAQEVIDSDQKNSINTTSKLYIYSQLTGYYADKGDLKNARIYLNKVELNHDETQGDLVNNDLYHHAVAHYEFAKGNYRKALRFAEMKLADAKKLKLEEEVLDSYELLSKIQAASGNYKASLESNKLFSSLKDSIYNKTTANTLAYYQTLYETEKKENALIAKSTNIQLLEKDNESAKKRLLYISLVLVSSFGMILLFRNRIRINNQRVLQEKFSQELLVSQEEERRRISKDLHDGLGQRLLLIKNKVVATKDSETKDLVETAIEEVRSISRNLHPFQLQELGITRAIEMTITQIDENTTLFITSEIDNIDNIFNKKQEVNLYRIVQESLSNVLKHAKAEAGKVVIKREPNLIRLTIRDNGVGFDFTEKYQNVKSLGLKTLLERTKFLKGQMKIQSKKNNGTLIEFQFPTA